MNSKGKVSFKNFQYFDETLLGQIGVASHDNMCVSKKSSNQEDSFENVKQTDRSLNNENEISINYLEGTDEFNDKNEMLEMKIPILSIEDMSKKIVKFTNKKINLSNTIKSINYENNNSSSNIIDVDYNLLKKQTTKNKISNTISPSIKESTLKNERLENIKKTNTIKNVITSKKDEFLNYFDYSDGENTSKREVKGNNLIDIKNAGKIGNIQTNKNDNGIIKQSSRDSEYTSSLSSLSNYSNSLKSSDKIISYTNYLFTLDNFERKIFPKELEIFSKLNKNETQIFSFNLNSPLNESNKKEDLKIRRIKLLQNSLFIYTNMESDQLLASIEINDNTFLDLGPKYKMTNEKNESIYYWNFTIWKDSKSYSFYSNDIEIMKTCVEMINKVISQNDIFQLYRISKTPIYGNKKKLLNIYRAKRKTDGKHVILKVINKNEGNSNHSLVMNSYLKEYKILNSLKHPYIIHNYLLAEKLDSVKIIQEYCAGGTLYDYLYSRNFNIAEKEACYIIFQLCSIVSYIHSYGIIHNDINLNSIFIENNCEFSDIRLGSFRKVSFNNIDDENNGYCTEYNGSIVRLIII